MRDALGIPKITYKLPFLKGRFALAAKVIQNKNDRQTKQFTTPTTTTTTTSNKNNDATTTINEISSSFSKTLSSARGDNDMLTSFKKQIKKNYPIAMWCEDVQQTQNRYNYRLFFETEKCCADHINGCSIVIPSGMMWNQLKNLGIYTR